MSTKNIPTPRQVLAIGAHPDDIEFGAGSTLAKWSADGCIVNLLICTDGSKGTWDPLTDIRELIETRKLEQLEAAKQLPVEGKVFFLGCTDGELEVNTSLRSRITRIIRELKPDVLLGHDPWKPYRLHPDHRAAGFLTIEALVAARDPHFFPEQALDAHRPKELLLFEANEIDHFEECKGFEINKINALLCHESQFKSTMNIDPNDTKPGIEEFKELVLEGLSHSDFPTAEGFKRITEL